LVLHPSVATLVTPYAVVTLWAAHQTAGDERGNGNDNYDNIGLVDVDDPESALILRSGLDVLVLRAPGGAVTFVDALQSGLNLGAAAACAIAASPHFDLTATLSQLLTHGALTALHLPRKLAE
jgi:hypothetical protein